MVQNLEIAILRLIEWYFGLPWAFGLPLLLVGCALFFVQWIKGSRAMLPGVGALCIFVFEICRFFPSGREKVVGWMQGAVDYLTTPHAPNPLTGVLGLFEPFFSIFVASSEVRHVHEEALFVALVAYLGFVACQPVIYAESFFERVPSRVVKSQRYPDP